MATPSPTERSAKPLRAAEIVALPKLIVVRDGAPTTPPQWSVWRVLKRLRFLPLAIGLVMLGGVIGLYFQPPGLQKLFTVLKLQPGGGSKSPIAVPVSRPATASIQTSPSAPRAVVGLGKLIPLGDVATLSPPFGAGDARIASIRAQEGESVAAGALLATLDNEQPIKAAIVSAHATVRAREATLAQVRESIRASRNEARAALDRARTTLANAEREFERVDTLFKRGVSTSVAADQKRTLRDEAAREVERLGATLSRFDNGNPDEQADVIVAARNLDAARADVARAEQDMEKAYIRAPRAGTVLTIHVRPGEKPGAKGVLSFGDIEHMTAELEIYQTEIGRVGIGDLVEVTTDALATPLSGVVSQIGLEVARQTVVDPSPAANTDARVVKVQVILDPASSVRSRRFTNLQVTGRIMVKGAP